MKQFTIVICLGWMFFISNKHLRAQSTDQERFIAKIISLSVDEDTGEREIKETGAGILVDWNKTTRYLYIATAAHVVRGSDSILVILKESQTNFQYPARIVQISQEEDLDLAVLNVKVPIDHELDFFKIQQVKLGAPSFGQELLIIGHPLGKDWVRNISNSVTTPSFVKFNTSPIGIDKGYSGGGVFTRQGRLAGMMYKVDGVQTYVLHIHEVKKALIKWNVLPGLIIDFKHDNSWMKYLIPGTALLGSSFILYDQFGRFNQELTALENTVYYPNVAISGPNSSLENLAEVQAYNEKLKQTQNKARQTLIVGGIGTVLGLVGSYKLTAYLNRVSKEKKRLQMSSRGYGRGSPVLLIPHGFSTGGSTIIGLTIKF